jgi:hypothetical protein
MEDTLHIYETIDSEVRLGDRRSFGAAERKSNNESGIGFGCPVLFPSLRRSVRRRGLASCFAPVVPEISKLKVVILFLHIEQAETLGRLDKSK